MILEGSGERGESVETMDRGGRGHDTLSPIDAV
jgi:hypothetical protein